MFPGRALHRLARTCCSTATLHHIIEPQLADFQEEWRASERFPARLAALARGYAAFWCVALLCVPAGLAKTARRLGHDGARRSLFSVTSLALFIVGLGSMRSWVRTGSIAWLEVIDCLYRMPVWPLVLSPLLYRYNRPFRMPMLANTLYALMMFAAFRRVLLLHPYDYGVGPWINALGLLVYGHLISRPSRSARAR